MTGAPRRPAPAISARGTLALAAVASLALHGAVLAGAHWLWGWASAPTAAPMRAIALVVASAERAAPGHARARPENAAPHARSPAPTEPATSPVRPAPEPRREPASALAMPPSPAPPESQARPLATAAPAHLAHLRPPPRPNPPTPDPREAGPVAYKAPPPAALPMAQAGESSTVPAPSVTAAAARRAKPGEREGAPSSQMATAPMTPPRAGIAGLANPAPAYPWLARRRGEEGRVVLTVSVGADGRPTGVVVKHSSGHARLDAAARRAVERWRFAPGRRAGRPVAGEIDVPISFRLTE